jgi:hypothetical protein
VFNSDLEVDHQRIPITSERSPLGVESRSVRCEARTRRRATVENPPQSIRVPVLSLSACWCEGVWRIGHELARPEHDRSRDEGRLAFTKTDLAADFESKSALPPKQQYCFVFALIKLRFALP